MACIPVASRSVDFYSMTLETSLKQENEAIAPEKNLIAPEKSEAFELPNLYIYKICEQLRGKGFGRMATLRPKGEAKHIRQS